MSETNSSSSGVILLALAILWVAFVLIYPWGWWPSAVSLSGLPRDMSAVPLKLPDDGPLRLMVKRGSKVTLHYQTPSEGQSNDKTLQAAGPTTGMPAMTNRLQDVRVLDVTCLGAGRSDCWAILSLPPDQAETVMRAGPIWVLSESQMETPRQRSGVATSHD
jgi:hypothetical protein